MFRSFNSPSPVIKLSVPTGGAIKRPYSPVVTGTVVRFLGFVYIYLIDEYNINSNTNVWKNNILQGLTLSEA